MPKPIEMPMSAFMTKAKADPSYTNYKARFGDQLATLNLQALYDRNLRMMTALGVWSSAQAADYARVAVGNALLKVKPEDMRTFDTFLSEQMRQDTLKTTQRETYINGLKTKAAAGELYTRLTAATELESKYYTAPPVRAPAIGAPAIPAKPAWMTNTNKALAWAVGNPAATADVKEAYRKAFDACSTRGGKFPIDSMSTLNAIWRKLVTGAPHYRAVNIMQPTKYPSSLAGDFLVKNVIKGFATTGHPAQGSTLWYDYALYFFAAIMTSQAFTDGNKRVSRLTYGLILVHGGVDFIAPNNTLGAQLGDM